MVPGQFQSRYYTVRSWDGAELVLDVVVHEEGLVTEWAWSSGRDCTGERVTLSEPKGSFAMPDSATWLMLVGDLTAMPAMARILRDDRPCRRRVWAEVPDDLPGYLPEGADVTWLTPPGAGRVGAGVGRRDDRLARGRGLLLDGGRVLADAGDPQAPDAGGAAAEHGVRRDGLLARRRQRQPRAVDPGPIWRAGKAAGQSDEEIWAAYDAAGRARPR